MKLNPFERFLVNNPLRAVFMRQTMAWFWTAARAPSVERVLEIGCGQGDGVGEIVRRFRPHAVDAFDLDERQVARARERIAVDGVPVRLWVGDAERIGVPDGTYDAVVELAILHHVPGWRRALAEVRRILRPGGLFLFEELSTEFFFDVPVVSRLLRRFTMHPWDTMFDFRTFRQALTGAGLRVTALRERPLPGWHQGVAVRD
ncbi:MAG TPA: class I SAM-dependent methyltransferase [Candidatus Binatia bacterium]|nr:class I SAM-dependent methyltransferase [Candidatus Binatia bacterium]